jgi:nitrile hydratase beta subunit
MDGIHDMGGMHGFGAIPLEDSESPFPEYWQGRVLAAQLALSGAMGGNIDRFRFLIESMGQAEYLSSSYYERWLASMLAALSENQLLDAAQLDDILSGIEPAATPRMEASEGPAVPPEAITGLLNSPAGKTRDMSGTPAFLTGDQVRAKREHRAGHTRLPRYVRGCLGEIVSDNGNQHLPDARADSGEFVMQRLYTVRFSARALWGEQANAKDSVCVDLWESYLEPG